MRFNNEVVPPFRDALWRHNPTLEASRKLGRPRGFRHLKLFAKISVLFVIQTELKHDVVGSDLECVFCEVEPDI
jgi:hypothetical protein